MKINIKTTVLLLLVLCVFSVIIMMVVLFNPTEGTGGFVPPSFESSAVTGIPTPPENLGWTELYQEGMNFIIGISGKIILDEQNRADVYFYNEDSNSVWLKLRVLDADDQILCETGLLRPGEYVKSIFFPKDMQVGDKIKLKVMAYQPETYYSEGSIVLNTTVQNGG